MIPNDQVKVKEVAGVPPGYRQLQDCLNETHKAYLFRYYAHELWIAKREILKCRGEFWTSYDAIERAKRFNEAESVPVVIPDARDALIKEFADTAFLCHLKPSPATYLTLFKSFADKLDALRKEQMKAVAQTKFQEGRKAAAINIHGAADKVFGEC